MGTLPVYSRLRARVKTVCLGLAVAAAGAGSPLRAAAPALSCDPALQVFVPRRPQLGRYEVCTTSKPLRAAAPRQWPVESMPPLDAFGAGGPYDRAALARLYGGRQAEVARGFIESEHGIESVTYVSPHPDGALSALVPGTLVVRRIIGRP
jgi:hypothetical protein